MKPLDVLYIVRNGRNPELVYSLRSLRNLPHGRVWLVGHKPRFVGGVEFIPGNRYAMPWHNVVDNLRLACERVDADRFVVMNDDIYIQRRTERLPSYYRGPLAEHAARVRGWWRHSLDATLEVLRERGLADPRSYELHVPVVMERAKLAAVLEQMPQRGIPPQWRTLYGNLWNIRARLAPDVKLNHRQQSAPLNGRFLSTDDHTFAAVHEHLARLFPEPSPYEHRAQEMAA